MLSPSCIAYPGRWSRGCVFPLLCWSGVATSGCTLLSSVFLLTGGRGGRSHTHAFHTHDCFESEIAGFGTQIRRAPISVSSMVGCMATNEDLFTCSTRQQMLVVAVANTCNLWASRVFCFGSGCCAMQFVGHSGAPQIAGCSLSFLFSGTAVASQKYPTCPITS